MTCQHPNTTMICPHPNTMETLDSYVCDDCGVETCVFNDNAGDKMLCSTHDGELRMTDEDWEDDSILMICDNAPELIAYKGNYYYDYCSLCDASPITINCNNANCS